MSGVNLDVQAVFEDYRDSVYKEKIGRVQEQEIRRAFYGGMLACFHAMLTISNEVQDEEKASQAVLLKQITLVGRSEVGLEGNS